MATMDKIQLSATADGDGVNIGTLSPIDGSDTTIHTAVSGTTDIDLVTLFAYNDHSAAVVLHLQWGDTTDSIKVSIPNQAGLVLIVADLPISDSNVITASAATVDVITIYGYVNRVDK
jgi:hypothetical protein